MRGQGGRNPAVLCDKREDERTMPEEKTDLLKRYYRESDPMLRRKILEKSIDLGEDPERNEIRMELWEARYREPSKAVKGSRSDGLLKVWMTLKYAEGNTGGILGGRRRTIRDLRKCLDKMEFSRWQAQGGMYRECLYEECIQMAEVYLESCRTDKNYRTGLMGMMALSDERIMDKITADIYGIACVVPRDLGMEEELAPIIHAVREVYRRKYPADEFEETSGRRKALLEGE